MRHASDRETWPRLCPAADSTMLEKGLHFCQGSGQKAGGGQKNVEAQDVTDVRVGGHLRVACHTVGVSASDLEPQRPRKRA